MKVFSWKLIVIAAVLLTAVIFVIPTLRPGTWPHKKINLGLDLQGGMQLVLGVDTEKAVSSTLERVLQDIQEEARIDRIRSVSLTQTGFDRIAVTVSGDDNISRFSALVKKEFPEVEERERTLSGGEMKMLLVYPDREIARIRTMSVEQALETIRNRIDQFGVSEPDIRIQGDEQIMIQLPGIQDTQRAKELIGKTALLEFRLVDEGRDPRSGSIPPGSEILYGTEEDPGSRRSAKTSYMVKKRAALTGAYLTDARVQMDTQYNRPYVSITFDKKGARIFERVTGENINKRLAIVLDGTVHSAPTINDRIAGGSAMITGQFTMEEASDLAIVLRAGALPAPVDILEERTVGPSLGTDSIRMGLLSMGVGGALIVLFMAIYYKISGLMADLALVLNILLIAGGLALLGATLTMPGIAGIILTIGMAIDANVLIFERIREELRQGKPLRTAVDRGYEIATRTILDANLTSLIVAVVLFQFGTGPIKGFAVTLTLGLVASVFTALVVTRTIFDFWLTYRKPRTISI
ncbi:protein translocase subunit SecD [Desulfosarcina sp. OttesenSCG-928-A07]|nr:protein translocase subunit SecD [Desulfosarcina sp. OttesenSCG-928-G17]MDL2328403.1 protein translocase subunit SecD [Desulfosarcina sp. OttesenSCG-928-A07]